MRRLLLIALLLCTCFLTARSAVAATIGVYFDSNGHERTRQVPEGDTFQWFVVVDDLDPDMLGVEFEVLVDPAIIVIGRQLLIPTATNIGQSSDNWVIGTGECISSSPAAIVAYTGILPSGGGSLVLDLGASSPSSSALGNPAYINCDATQIRDFDEATSALINPDERSWGAVKQLYE
jgi:hypothetical protein